MNLDPQASGTIKIKNAVTVKILKIERHWFRPAVLVEWRVGRERAERRWVRVDDILAGHLDVDVQPDLGSLS